MCVVRMLEAALVEAFVRYQMNALQVRRTHLGMAEEMRWCSGQKRTDVIVWCCQLADERELHHDDCYA